MHIAYKRDILILRWVKVNDRNITNIIKILECLYVYQTN